MRRQDMVRGPREEMRVFRCRVRGGRQNWERGVGSALWVVSVEVGLRVEVGFGGEKGLTLRSFRRFAGIAFWLCL